MNFLKNNALMFYGHWFFTSFTLNLFFIFGALLVYSKTESVFLTLFFYLLIYVSIIFSNTVFLKIFINALNRFGFKKVMVVGLIVLSGSYFLLFFTSNDVRFFNLIIFCAAILNGMSSNLYYMPAGTVRLNFIGKSKKPGFVSALYSANGIFSGILAVILALMFNLRQELDLLFLFAGASLIMSCLFLYYVEMKKQIYRIHLREYVSRLSFWEHLACAETTHELRTIALPLVILFSLGSISKSIWISGVVAIGTILIISITGHLKDKNNNFLLYAATLGSFFGWMAYLFVDSEAGFIVAGILTGMTYKMINSNFEARMGRCVANSECGLDVRLAFNFSQILGRILIVVLLIGLYFFTGNIGKSILFLGFVFLIPKVAYALGKIDKLKRDANKR